MAGLTLLCRTMTTFGADGGFDEDAYCAFLQRMVDAKHGVYLAGSGSGEGYTLTPQELRRNYEVGVSVCKGKVPTNGNPPEQHTPRMVIEHARLAIDCGVEVVCLYGPAAWHGFRPTDAELRGFFDTILKEIKHPVAIAPNPTVGYAPSAALFADVANKYKQVVAVNLVSTSDTYFIEIKDRLRPGVETYVPVIAAMETLRLGATGFLGSDSNIIPKTYRKFIDLLEANDLDGAAKVYADLRRFTRYVSKYHSGGPRWQKMAMKVLKIPGWKGGVRGPYLMPGDEDVAKFAEGLLKLNIPEINEMAKAAKLKLPK